MSNTWDYRFAFRLESREDVPPEFRSPYDRLVRANGLPVFGLFTPSVEEHGLLISRGLPPRVVLVFPQSFALLSLDTESNAVGIFELGRTDFLGFGFAEFMLSCWFTLYQGYSEGGKTLVRLPARAAEHYWELIRILLDWWGGEGEAIGSAPQLRMDMSGFPAKFSSFAKTHPEFGTVSEFFFQPAMEPPRQTPWSFWQFASLHRVERDCYIERPEPPPSFRGRARDDVLASGSRAVGWMD